MSSTQPAFPNNYAASISCRTVIPVSHYIYTWVIENVKFCKQPSGCSFDSPEFRTGSHRWILKLYSTAKTQYSTDYAGIYLKSLDNRVNINVKIYIVDKARKERFTFVSACSVGYSDEIGHNDKLPSNEIFKEDSDLCPDETLTIRCEIDIAGKPSNIQSNITEGETISVLLEELNGLLESSRFSDVTLSVQGKDFKVHKTILSARSSVFAAMFEHDMMEKNSSSVVINDVNNDVMQEVLKYIYTGKCSKLQEKVVEILAVAEKYDLSHLKKLCEQTLLTEITMDKVLPLIKLSYLYNLELLKSEATKYITLNEVNMKKTNEWKEFLESDPHICLEIYSENDQDLLNILKDRIVKKQRTK